METPAAVESPLSFQKIPVEKIQPSPYQPRKDFTPEDLQDLADSMKEEGLLQPVLVRPCTVHGAPSTAYELVSGERRYRAAKLLNWPTIEAKVVQTVSEAEAAAKSLVENLQRKDLNPIEEAEGFDRLNKLDPQYWSQDAIAKVAGKDKTYLSRSLKLLETADLVKDQLRRRNLSREHGIEISRLPKEQQARTCEEVFTKRLSRSETRKLVDRRLNASPAAAAASAPSATPAPANLARKGDEIAINRRFKPGRESAEAFIGWLSQALPAFAAARHNGQDPQQPSLFPPHIAELPRKIVDTGDYPSQARLPQSPQEEVELSAIAAGRGPKAVYTWIYGADNPITQAVPATGTWEEMGTTAREGLQHILAGIKHLRDLGVSA